MGTIGADTFDTVTIDGENVAVITVDGERVFFNYRLDGNYDQFGPGSADYGRFSAGIDTNASNEVVTTDSGQRGDYKLVSEVTDDSIIHTGAELPYPSLGDFVGGFRSNLWTGDDGLNKAYSVRLFDGTEFINVEAGYRQENYRMYTSMDASGERDTTIGGANDDLQIRVLFNYEQNEFRVTVDSGVEEDLFGVKDLGTFEGIKSVELGASATLSGGNNIITEFHGHDILDDVNSVYSV